MADRLTDSQMYKLVEIYRDYECLWDVRNTEYKDREARNEAYMNVWERLNIPGLTVKMVPKKIKNLRSSYYQELKKIEKSRSGVGKEAVYEPKVSWFSMADGFLKEFTKRRRTYSYIDDDDSSSENDLEKQKTKSENLNSEGTSNFADDKMQDNSNVVWVVKNLSTPTVSTNQSETCSPGFTVSSTANKGWTGKRKDDVDIHDAIAKLDKIADNITATTASLIEKEGDEFDTFGKYIAMTLRSLPRELAIVGKTDIQKVVSEIQLKALRQDSPTLPASYEASASDSYNIKIEIES